MAQQVIVLRNAALHESAVASDVDPGPSHVCEGLSCSCVHECDWLRRWRAEQAKNSTATPRRAA